MTKIIDESTILTAQIEEMREDAISRLLQPCYWDRHNACPVWPGNKEYSNLLIRMTVAALDRVRHSSLQTLRR